MPFQLFLFIYKEVGTKQYLIIKNTSSNKKLDGQNNMSFKEEINSEK